MRLAVGLPVNRPEDPGSWDFVLDCARLCDRAGVDKIVAFDHVVFGENLAAYSRPETGGRPNATQSTGSDGCYLEPMTTLAAACAVTEHVRLGTNVLLAALRRPVVLAKAAATLDVLSKGRFDLGVGVGWQQEEYEAAGLSFADRGRLLDHTLEVCRTLWREQRASYDSPELRFANIHAMPKPAQPGGVPIWVGGRVNRKVARRIARFGSGWITWDVSPADMAGSIARMRELVEDAGGNPAFAVQGEIYLQRTADGRMDLARTMADVPVLHAAGVTDVTLYRLRLPADQGRAIDELGAVVSAFRSAAKEAPRSDVRSG